MTLISLKDYAKQNNISYEAVRQQVVRYAADLEGHIIKDGRQQFLDEEAVAFLDSKRQKNPVAIIQQDKDEQLETLRNEKEQLLLKIAAQADKISELSEWKADNAVAIAEAKQQIFLLEEKNRTIDALAEKAAELSADKAAAEQKAHDAESAAKETADELADVRSELETLKSKWWYKLFTRKARNDGNNV